MGEKTNALVNPMVIGDNASGNTTTIELDGTMYHSGDATVFEDDKYQLIGQRLDTSSGRIDANYDEITIDFADNARYPNEFVAVACQILHARKTDSDIHPHLHWNQTSSAMPNILASYRWYNNGDIIPDVWTNVAVTATAYTWVSDTLAQISGIALPVGLGTGKELSSFFDVKLYRDSSNASGLFAGADAYTGILSMKEFDIHIEKDMEGSRQEYIK